MKFLNNLIPLINFGEYFLSIFTGSKITYKFNKVLTTHSLKKIVIWSLDGSDKKEVYKIIDLIVKVQTPSRIPSYLCILSDYGYISRVVKSDRNITLHGFFPFDFSIVIFNIPFVSRGYWCGDKDRYLLKTAEVWSEHSVVLFLSTLTFIVYRVYNYDFTFFIITYSLIWFISGLNKPELWSFPKFYIILLLNTLALHSLFYKELWLLAFFFYFTEKFNEKRLSRGYFDYEYSYYTHLYRAFLPFKLIKFFERLLKSDFKLVNNISHVQRFLNDVNQRLVYKQVICLGETYVEWSHLHTRLLKSYEKCHSELSYLISNFFKIDY